METTMKLLALLLPTLLITSCARNIETNTYKASTVGQAQITYRGVIERVDIVDVEEEEYLENHKVGGIGGGALGGVLGYKMSDGGPLGTVLGAAAGAVGGALLEKNLKKQQGALYTVKTSQGALLSVTQGLQPLYSVGQKVRVILGQGRDRTRIISD